MMHSANCIRQKTRSGYATSMTSPRFVPRNYCSSPALFGRYPILLWEVIPETDTRRLDQLGVAKLQAAIAYRVRRAILLSPDLATIENYAAKYELEPTRLGRWLRGSVVMALEDMVSTERNLGISLWAPAESPAEHSAQ